MRANLTAMNSQSRSAPQAAGDGGNDWAAKAADLVEGAVCTVRHRAVEPIMAATRFIALGAIMVVMAVSAAILLVAGLMRLFDSYFFGSRVWATDALLGLILLSAGAALWSRRHQPVRK